MWVEMEEEGEGADQETSAMRREEEEKTKCKGRDSGHLALMGKTVTASRAANWVCCLMSSIRAGNNQQQ